MEVKIDKRTKEYKDSQMQPPGVLTPPVYLRGAGLKSEVPLKGISVDKVVFDEVGLGDSLVQPSSPSGEAFFATEGAVEPIQQVTTPDSVVAAIKLLESVGATVTPPVQDTTEEEWGKMMDRRTIKSNPIKPEQIPVTQSKVDYDICNDPHGRGCRLALPPLEMGAKRVKAEPCRSCVWLNKDKKVGMSVREKIERDEHGGA